MGADITPEAQAGADAPAQDLSNTPNTTEAQAAQPTQGQGPWANDLVQRFADDGVRGQVDEFLRGSVQPHVTRLEQDLARYEPAHRLYDDLVQNPQDTWLALTEEIYGADAAEQLKTLFVQEADETATDAAEQEVKLPPEYQEAIDYVNRQRSEAFYKTELDRVAELAKQQNVELDPNVFAPFVTAAGGDFDLALRSYVPWEQANVARYQERFGSQAPANEDEPLAVLGTQATGQTSPPVQEKYNTIEDALDATLAEMRENAAPPAVGSV